MTDLRVLHLEDSILDADLLRSILEKDGIRGTFVRVEDEASFTNELLAHPYDLIISDYNLPSYDGLAALYIAKRLRPDTPFIFVSGTIGEERAVESLKQGATDYVLKDHLSRLTAAVQRALAEAREKQARKTAEAKLREQAALIDIDPAAIISMDMTGNILVWSNGAEKLYGWKRDEVLGKPFAQVLFPGQAAAYNRIFRILLSSREWTGELARTTQSGDHVTVESRMTLVVNESAEPVSVYIVDTDITQQKKLEEQVMRAQRLESLGTLSAGIAHDLNNVLGPIILGIDMLMDSGMGQKQKELLKTMERSARHGANLVNQVKTLIRGKSEGREVVDPAQLMEEVKEFADHAFPKAIRLAFDVSPNLWNIHGDPTQIHQVVLNLCVNARDAMPKGGVLTLGARNEEISASPSRRVKELRPGKYVVLTVSDTGPGIPPEHKEKIFEPFFTTKGQDQGTGLGLSTSRMIVEKHEGAIQVSSTPGAGTTFSVYLPWSEKKETAPGGEAHDMPAGNGELVLVVDDEATIRDLTKQTLETFGYKVLLARDGPEAIAAFTDRKSEIDLVLCDLVMPFLDGRQTSTALHRIDADIRIMIMSGTISRRTFGHKDIPGVRAFLEKPFSVEQLLKAVDTILRAGRKSR